MIVGECTALCNVLLHCDHFAIYYFAFVSMLMIMFCVGYWRVLLV